jgi:hypothetical protein
MELMDDLHACADLPVVKPKHEMTEREYQPRQAFAMVRDGLTLDGDSRRDLAFGEGVSQEKSPRSSLRAKLRSWQEEPIDKDHGLFRFTPIWNNVMVKIRSHTYATATRKKKFPFQ